MTAAVRRVRGGSPWEESIGCARAVVAGDRVLVGGTTAFKDSVLFGEGDPYEQARVAFTSALEAIGAVGLGADSVVRTRIYLAHARDVEAACRAHREIFAEVRPVSTLVIVSGFADPRVLVEVELEAVLGEAAGTGVRAPEPGPAPGEPAPEAGSTHGPAEAGGGPAGAGAEPVGTGEEPAQAGEKPAGAGREAAEPPRQAAEPGGESAR